MCIRRDIARNTYSSVQTLVACSYHTYKQLTIQLVKFSRISRDRPRNGVRYFYFTALHGTGLRYHGILRHGISQDQKNTVLHGEGIDSYRDCTERDFIGGNKHGTPRDGI